MFHRHYRFWRAGAALAVLALALLYGITFALVPNRQPWAHIPGGCDPALDGAVLGLAGTGCGDGGTTFDTQQVYAPAVLKDVAGAAAPCPGIADGATCFRMWYVGDDASGTLRIGYATSPDGIAWTRVPGAAAGGSVLGAGSAGSFDSHGAAYMTVMKDGATFKIWYAGFGPSYIEGIGYATSTDGRDWTRVPGPLAGGAVLRASGAGGAFDEHAVNTPNVIKDRATALAPCPNVPEGEVCYRMWYEGVNTTNGYTFRVGYATSPDGLAWTRVPGAHPSGAVLERGPAGSFDENSVGVPAVVKDGAIYRMWYEAKDFADRFSLGHVVSTDGVAWERPDPNQAIWRGSDDPGSFVPDNVWAAGVLKDGPTYRMWYSASTQPDAQRIGYAAMTPGAALAGLVLERDGGEYALRFTTGAAIPAGGSLLLTFPPELPIAQVTAGQLDGFGAGADLVVDPAALGDAPARRTVRGALLLRLTAEAPPGPKTIRFSLAMPPLAPVPLLVQTFDTREVLEHGAIELLPDQPTPSPTPSSTATATPTSSPTATATPTGTPTATASPTPAGPHTADHRVKLPLILNSAPSP